MMRVYSNYKRCNLVITFPCMNRSLVMNNHFCILRVDRESQCITNAPRKSTHKLYKVYNDIDKLRVL